MQLVVLVLTAAELGALRFALVPGSAAYLSPYLFVLLPYTHDGPFLLTLAAAAVAQRAAEQRGARPAAGCGVEPGVGPRVGPAWAPA